MHKPIFDSVSGRWLTPVRHDSVRGEVHEPQAEPQPPVNTARIERIMQAEAEAAQPHTAPGIPSDPVAFLALLRDGPVSDEAARYLRNPVNLAQYDAAINASAPGDHQALARTISAAWHAWLAANPQPVGGMMFDPFNP